MARMITGLEILGSVMMRMTDEESHFGSIN
jgi:hypothetical protein